MATSKVTLKLLINTTEHKVLFAEAGKDFVDFLFYIFSLPVGTIVMLLKNKPMVGCLGDLYQSIETLNETYIEPNQKKNSVLNPKFPVCPSKTPLMLPDNQSKTGYFYMCPNRHSYVADVPNLPCASPTCKLPMTQQLTYVSLAAAEAETGFVKDVVTYMVMDNLEVMPMSTISCITLINRFNVKDLGSLEEKVVDFGVDEGLMLLKATLECKNVLTSVFLVKMEA